MSQNFGARHRLISRRMTKRGHEAEEGAWLLRPIYTVSWGGLPCLFLDEVTVFFLEHGQQCFQPTTDKDSLRLDDCKIHRKNCSLFQRDKSYVKDQVHSHFSHQWWRNYSLLFSSLFSFSSLQFSSLQFAWAKQGHSCGFSLDMGNF